MIATISIPEPPEAPVGYDQIEITVLRHSYSDMRHFRRIEEAVEDYLDRGRGCTMTIYASRWLDDDTSETFVTRYDANFQQWTEWEEMR